MGHAPSPIAYESSAGGWNLVVMEALAISKYQHPGSYRSYRLLSDYCKTVLDIQPLERAVKGLHAEGYIHGDLRDVNFVVLDKGQETSADFMLLDLDRAGPIDKTDYPIYINQEGIDRPRETRRYI